ncbi:MAG TPA: hypothetical protein VEZ42_19635 [Pseudonocardia sp.]|nr:hypothetical protein [Pseudonocardia sp.]
MIDDSFMSEPAGHRWSGARLMEHFGAASASGSPHPALNVHTLWALILARPHLLQEQPRLRGVLEEHVGRLLDAPDLQAATRIADAALRISPLRWRDR